MILYKYGIINKYTLSSLNSKKIWMSKPGKFNDPYEFKLKRIDKNNLHLVKGLQKIKDDNPKIQDDEKLIDIVISHYQKEIENFGVACFSESNNDMLMWSHYADNHFGLCLGFDVGENPGEKGFYKINYSTDYPEIDLENIWHKDGLMKILYTKGKAWEYEKEWRLITTDGDVLLPYTADLVEVVFGNRTTPNDIELVKSILSKDNINFFQAIINSDNYLIDIEPF